jgi:hypothetical protein
MTTSELAAQLRKRLIYKKLVDSSLLRSVSDDEVIDAYITCSCCGRKQVNDSAALARIVKQSDSVEIFFELCNSASAKHRH